MSQAWKADVPFMGWFFNANLLLEGTCNLLGAITTCGQMSTRPRALLVSLPSLWVAYEAEIRQGKE
jgi:hypothetical protein